MKAFLTSKVLCRGGGCTASEKFEPHFYGQREELRF